MKDYLQVQKDRINYHAQPSKYHSSIFANSAKPFEEQHLDKFYQSFLLKEIINQLL